MQCRNDYETLFMRHGIDRRQLSEMPDTIYRQRLDEFLRNDCPPPGSGFDSSYRYVSQSVLEEDHQRMRDEYQNGLDEEEAMRLAMQNSLEENYAVAPETEEAKNDRQILRDQDEEYLEACAAESKRLLDKSSDEHFQRNEALIEQSDREHKEAEVFRHYYHLPKEPEKGVSIAFMVNGERLMRKFNPEEKGIDVYSWIAGEVDLSDENEKLFLDNFEVAIAGGGILDPCMSLEDQGLKGRVMVHISML